MSDNACPVLVELVDADDWKGLYIDGKLLDEGHGFTVKEFVEALKYVGFILPFTFKQTYLEGAELAEIQDIGCFPETRSTLKDKP